MNPTEFNAANNERKARVFIVIPGDRAATTPVQAIEYIPWEFAEEIILVDDARRGFTIEMANKGE